MAGKQRVLILTVVLAAAAVLLLRPYMNRPLVERGFAVTQNPVTAIEEALVSGMPLFIEFYSDT